MQLWNSIAGIVKDAPPAFVFELSEAGLATARRTRPPQLGFRPLEKDVLAISPVHDNVTRPEALAQQVRAFASEQSGKKQGDAVLVLPDYSVLISVVDFDSLPSDAAERLTLVRFRIKKSVPFDVESAAVSYYVQQSPGNRKKFDVVVAVAPLEIVARYEAPFRAAGFHTGVVTTSTLAALKLVQPVGISVVAKLSGRILTISVLQQGVLKLMRCVELTDISLAEILSYLYPTFAYTEDQLGAKPEKLYLCGMDALHGEAEQEEAPPMEMPAAEPVNWPLAVPAEAVPVIEAVSVSDIVPGSEAASASGSAPVSDAMPVCEAVSVSEQPAEPVVAWAGGEEPDRWSNGHSDSWANEPVNVWASGPMYTPAPVQPPVEEQPAEELRPLEAPEASVAIEAAEPAETPPVAPARPAPPPAHVVLGRELGVPVEILRSRFAAPGEHDAGLLGCLESLEGF